MQLNHKITYNFLLCFDMRNFYIRFTFEISVINHSSFLANLSTYNFQFLLHQKPDCPFTVLPISIFKKNSRQLTQSALIRKKKTRNPKNRQTFGFTRGTSSNITTQNQNVFVSSQKYDNFKFLRVLSLINQQPTLLQMSTKHGMFDKSQNQ